MPDNRVTIAATGGFYPAEQADTLAVLLHAFDQAPTSLQRVAEAVREEFPRSDIYAPRLPFQPWSCADPEAVAEGIVRYLSALPRIGEYGRIVFVGHSFGAVMARKVWALAHGATPAAAVDSARAQPWAAKIERIVLLAAMNRGWTVSSALKPLDRLAFAFASGIGHFMRHVLGCEPTIFGIRRGAAFLSTMRLQSLAVANALGERNPIVVQLLGTDDDQVAPADNLDLAAGRNFHYIEIAEATHRGIVELQDEGPQGALARFRLALRGERAVLAEAALKLSDLHDIYDESPDDYDAVGEPLQDDAVKRVVFVIHGIRDRGFWTRRIAREVKRQSRLRDMPCRAVTSTYGFFRWGRFFYRGRAGPRPNGCWTSM
ncbi:MAG: alpha/beta hydrolase [Alphaproteobacteria bacterium]|nr:alpha/beta hydrolase [Alphaproteobacteria bacterium]